MSLCLPLFLTLSPPTQVVTPSSYSLEFNLPQDFYFLAVPPKMWHVGTKTPRAMWHGQIKRKSAPQEVHTWQQRKGFVCCRQWKMVLPPFCLNQHQWISHLNQLSPICMWLFEFKFELIAIKWNLETQCLCRASCIPHAQILLVTWGHHLGQCRDRTFLSSQKVF